MLLIQEIWRALSLALARAGRSKPARMAMMAITTSNSIRVNAVVPAGSTRAPSERVCLGSFIGYFRLNGLIAENNCNLAPSHSRSIGNSACALKRTPCAAAPSKRQDTFRNHAVDGNQSAPQHALHFGPHLVQRLGFIQIPDRPFLPSGLEGLFVEHDPGKKNNGNPRPALFDRFQQVQ